MIFKKTFSLTLAFMLFLSSCSFSRKVDHETISKIYSQTIAYDFQHEWMGSKTYCSDHEIIINAKTDAETVNGETFKKDDWEWARKNLPQLQGTTWDDFLQKNSQPISFPSDLDIGCPYTLLDTKANQPDYSLEICASIYYLSQIGFSDNKNQALVYLTKTCGDYGHGNLYLLELTDHQWNVTHMEEVFIT